MEASFLFMQTFIIVFDNNYLFNVNMIRAFVDI